MNECKHVFKQIFRTVSKILRSSKKLMVCQDCNEFKEIVKNYKKEKQNV